MRKKLKRQIGRQVDRALDVRRKTERSLESMRGEIAALHKRINELRADFDAAGIENRGKVLALSAERRRAYREKQKLKGK
jgi:hypothetical protein